MVMREAIKRPFLVSILSIAEYTEESTKITRETPMLEDVRGVHIPSE
jgi:hypothetical protein